jgi:hypothetical protein
MTVICDRCHRSLTVSTLAFEHVFGYCRPCFAWLLRRRR